MESSNPGGRNDVKQAPGAVPITAGKTVIRLYNQAFAPKKLLDKTALYVLKLKIAGKKSATEYSAVKVTYNLLRQRKKLQ